MTLRILLVDDEPLVLEGVKGLIEELNLPCEIESECLGMQALRSAMLREPDILITDVCMPVIDGIELATQIRNAYPDCRIIFLSIHSDKAYLKSAIHLGALDYIDKPVTNNSNLARVLQETVTEIITERNHKKRRIHDYSGARKLFALQLCQMLTQRELNEREIIEQCERFDMGHFLSDYYRCAVIFVPENTHLMLSELLEKGNGIHVIEYLRSPNQHVAFFYSDSSENLGETWLKHVSELIASQIKGAYLCCGLVSNSYRTAEESFRQAMAASEQYFYSGDNVLYIYQAQTDGQLDFGDTWVADFTKLLYGFDIRKCIAFLESVFNQLMNKRQTAIIQIKTFYCALADRIHLFAKENHLAFGTNYTKETLYNVIWESPKLLQIHKALCTWLAELLRTGTDEISDEHIIRLTQAYIYNNLDKTDLDISSISDFTGYSSSYLCKQFKGTMGLTINQYINQERIKKARKLLVETSANLGVIASQTGFGSVQYFCRIFKKKMGISPGDFRERELKKQKGAQA